MPSQDPSDKILLFTDASQTSLSGLLCQHMRPVGVKDGPRQLYIVGTFSKVVKPDWSNWPIWLLELTALYESTRKWASFLAGRPFHVITDSETVRHWISLDKVPRDLARKIIQLQRFQYRILFVESRLNPADVISRLETDAPEGTYPRFLRARVFNSRNELIPWTSLFSQRKCDDAVAFFTRTRNQPLSRAADALPEFEEEEEDDEPTLFTPDHEISRETTSSTSAFTSNAVLPENAVDVYTSVAWSQFTQEECEDMHASALDDEIVEDESMRLYGLPVFGGARLHNVKDLRHRSLYRLNTQGIVFRFWSSSTHPGLAGPRGRQPGPHDPARDFHPLIVVGEKKFDALLERYHSFTDSGVNAMPHLCVTIDCAGPLRGWASSSSGKPRYLFISIDNFSRYVFARVMSDVKDASILRSIRELRHALSGLPMKVQCDNALLTKNSNSRRFPSRYPLKKFIFAGLLRIS